MVDGSPSGQIFAVLSSSPIQRIKVALNLSRPAYFPANQQLHSANKPHTVIPEMGIENADLFVSADGGRAYEEAEDDLQMEASFQQYLEGVSDSVHADGGRAHEEAEDEPQVEASVQYLEGVADSMRLVFSTWRVQRTV